MIKIKHETVIYVLCPAYSKTGGPELLHQLVFELNNQGKKAYITYYDYNENKNYTDPSYKKYINGHKLIDEIEDNVKNVIIFPEIYYGAASKYVNCKKVMWWLSVDNYLKGYRFIQPIKLIGFMNFLRRLKGRTIYFTNRNIKSMDYHLCQSYYAIDFLKKMNIENIEYLSDYLNDIYLNEKNISFNDRENNVLYNPKKGIKFTKKIINTYPELNWIPIQNMSNDEVKQLLLKSKVYIDFGNHPGKDRFPREAAICGCCVITGKKGSAKYHEDVPISDEFKFEDKDENISKICNCIKECLNNYEKEIKKFDGYRNFIRQEKDKFAKSITNIFVWSDENVK